MGVSIFTSTQIPPEIINKELKKYERLSWSYEKEIIGSASYFLTYGNVDGVIFILSFGCGPGSIILEIINREVRRNKDIPFLTLVIDEHTQDTGIITRVESFIDTVRMRKNEVSFSAYG
ncbi:MAG: hypothetical protein QME40_03375 [bacterium]|nr:hypothetical protein [bacterium]